jgi:hypothetical protein
MVLVAVFAVLGGHCSIHSGHEVQNLDTTSKPVKAPGLLDNDLMSKAEALFEDMLHVPHRSAKALKRKEFLRSIDMVKDNVFKVRQEQELLLQMGEGRDTELIGWQMGETGDGEFAFQRMGVTEMFVTSEGEVWGKGEEGYLARKSMVDADPGRLNDESKITSGMWTLGETRAGHFGIFLDNEVRMFIQTDGEVWGFAKQGYLQKKAEADPELDKSLPTTEDLKQGASVSSGSWRAGETALGHFAFYHGNELKMLIHDSGEIYGAAEGGWFKLYEKATRDAGTIPKPISTEVIDCAVSDWTAFGPCDKKCGGGTQHRHRHITTEALNGGAECPQLVEERVCNTRGCAADCEVTKWSTWADCTADCGGGQQVRGRQVTVYPSSRGEQCPSLTETRACGMTPCDKQLCNAALGAAWSRKMDSSSDVYFTVSAPPAGQTGHEAGATWVRYNLINQLIEKGPASVKEHKWFENLPDPFNKYIDAALNRNGKSDEVFLFSGEMWLSWDLANDRPVKGPYRMNEHPWFENLPEPFVQGIDAAFSLKGDSDEAMLFSSQLVGEGADQRRVAMYLTWDLLSNKVLSGPTELNETPGLNLPAPFTERVDAALNVRGDADEMYLFSGSMWGFYDFAARQLLAGPFNIVDHPMFRNVSQALHLCRGYDLQQLGNYTAALDASKPGPLGTITRIAGGPIKGYVDNIKMAGSSATEAKGSGEKARFSTPSGVVLLGQGSATPYAYVLDTDNNAVRRISLLEGHNTTTIAGGSVLGGFSDGLGAVARFNSPKGISGYRLGEFAGAAAGDVLFVADTGNNAIRKLFITEGEDSVDVEVTTAAGGGASKARCLQCEVYDSTSRCSGCCECSTHGFLDLPDGYEAQFNAPEGISVIPITENATAHERSEFVYIADTKNHAIRRLVINPGTVSGEVVTIAGGQLVEAEDVEHFLADIKMGKSGFAEGTGSTALFNLPNAISAFRRGPTDVMYIADSENNAVRRAVVASTISELEVITPSEAEEAGVSVDASRRLLNTRQLLGGGGNAKPHLVRSKPQKMGEDSDEDPAADDEPLSVRKRWTTDGGSVPKDTMCLFPFTFNEIGYNDCSTVADSTKGIEGFSPENGWCLTKEPVADLALEWGPCAPANYEPDYCIVSEWSTYGDCTESCGGGQSTRVRSVQHEGDGGTGCPNLNETKTCNIHACGFTKTIAGGVDHNGNSVGFGVTDLFGTPDMGYHPSSIAAAHIDGGEVVFVAGNPSNSELLRRIDVNHTTNSACTNADDDSLDVGRDMDECRQADGGDGTIEAKMSTFAQTPTYAGATGLAIHTEYSLYATTIAWHDVSKIDLSLKLECGEWMNTDLANWPLQFSNGTIYSSNIYATNLDAGFGRTSVWNFQAHRKVKTFTYEGLGHGEMYKHTLCTQQQSGSEPGAPAAGPESCCVFKGAPELKEPTCDLSDDSVTNELCKRDEADWRAAISAQATSLKSF